MDNQNNKEVIGKLIFSQRVAKRLIGMGNDVIDIEPNKGNRNKTVFVFQKNDKLSRDLDEATKKENNETDNQRKVVSSTLIARQLIRRGFRPIDINPDKNNSDRTVFYFNKTDALDSAISDIMKEARRGDEKVLKVPVDKTV